MNEFTAPHIEQYLKDIGNRFYYPCLVSPSLLKKIDILFNVCVDLMPEVTSPSGTVKTIWLRIPRGTFKDYEDAVRFQEPKPRKRWQTGKGYGTLRDVTMDEWLSEYPEEFSWYRLDLHESESFLAAYLNQETVFCVLRNRSALQEELSHNYPESLVELLIEAASQSMDMVRSGVYNGTVQAELPYRYRFGVIKGEYVPEPSEPNESVTDKNTYISIMPCFVSSRDSYYMATDSKYGMLTEFMHVDDEDMALFGDKIEWDPLYKAELQEQASSAGEMDEYNIPADIDAMIPSHFYAAIAGELYSIYGWERGKDVFYPDKKIYVRSPYDLQADIAVWTEAFKTACRKLGLEMLLSYYDKLSWHDRNRFNSIMENRVCEQFIRAADCVQNEYYRHLIGNISAD